MFEAHRRLTPAEIGLEKVQRSAGSTAVVVAVVPAHQKSSAAQVAGSVVLGYLRVPVSGPAGWVAEWSVGMSTFAVAQGWELVEVVRGGRAVPHIARAGE